MHSSQPAPSDTAAASGLIRITLNGELRELAPQSLAQWLATQGIAPASVATAVNGEFIARDARAACQLRAGDALMTFQAIEGG